MDETNNAITAPEFLADVCGEVAAGGTLAKLCRERGLIFKLVATWLGAEKDRRDAYQDALDIRERHHKDEIIEQLANMVRADLTTAFAPDGSLLPVAEIPEAVRHWIAGIEVEEIWAGRGDSRAVIGTLKKVRFWDKVRSTELLMRNLKMLIDRHEVTGKLTLADLIAPEDEKKP